MPHDFQNLMPAIALRTAHPPLPQAPGPVGVDPFGCTADRLSDDQALIGKDVQFYRKSSLGKRATQVEMPATDRGVLLGVSLRGGHRRRIFDGRHGRTHDFDNGAIYLRSLAVDYKADFCSDFDFMLVEISRTFIERVAIERGAATPELQPLAAHADPVLAHLAHAMVPLLQHPEQACQLFVDQLSLAIGAHLVHRYGHGTALPEDGGKSLRRLPPRSVERAKEMLAARFDGNLSVGEVADACQLSRSHFTRAFRESTGQTPHQWLIERRLERAYALLRDTDLPLAEVAVSCGFCDQSHFTRVFARATGVTPGVWRRGAAG